MRAAHEANHAIARRLKLGLTDVQALDHLLARPLGPGELAARLGLRAASATALIDRLEEAGHVERRPHPGDRRRLVIAATEHAQREAFLVLRPLIAALEAASDHMSESERRAAARYLARVHDALKAFAAADRQAAEGRGPGD